jgi:hypothetical protein
MKGTEVEPSPSGQGQRQKGEVRVNTGYAANGVRLLDIAARDHEVRLFSRGTGIFGNFEGHDLFWENHVALILFKM